MNNIKGLYFKLNMNKRPDKDIKYFFERESKYYGITKIELLCRMISAYYIQYGNKSGFEEFFKIMEDIK